VEGSLACEELLLAVRGGYLNAYKAGQAVFKIGPETRGNVTQYAYDVKGDLTSVTDALGPPVNVSMPLILIRQPAVRRFRERLAFSRVIVLTRESDRQTG
jgi:hypothetical protein